MSAPHADDPKRRLTVLVSGQVQGVGFRWWTRRVAGQLDLVGFAENLADGRVRVVAEGSEAMLRQLLAALNSDRTPGHVRATEAEFSNPMGNMSEFMAI
jgi:acylphosphatase